MNFLDVKTDYAFKKVFGTLENKPILIKFLNSIITFPDNNKIKDLTIVDPYNIPMLKGMKDTFVDVKAVLDNDTKVIVEMQVLNHQGFEKRVLYNAAKNYSVQLKRSDNYHLLNPVIALSIVDFDMFEENKNVITNFKLLEKKQFINYSDDIELIFIELPKFNKELNELEEITDQWIYFVKNAGDLDLIPNELDDTIKLALQSVNEATLTMEELELQHKRKEFIYIQNSSIKLAEKQGIEQGVKQGIEQGVKQGIEQGVKQGIEQGVKQGIEQRNLEIAKNLLDILDDKTIAQKTGLAAEKIKMLR